MAVAIPESFGDHALLFAGCVRRDSGRSSRLSHLRRRWPRDDGARACGPYPHLVRCWRACCGSPGVWWTDARLALWLTALAIDYAAPLALFWVPGRPRLTNETWDVETVALRRAVPAVRDHRARRDDRAHRRDDLRSRCSTSLGSRAFGLAFLSTAALWWLYFNYVARIAERRLELAPSSTRLARDGYTYLHVRDRRRRDPLRRRRRAGDRAPDGGAADCRDRRRRRRAGRSTSSPTCCSGCGWPAR